MSRNKNNKKVVSLKFLGTLTNDEAGTLAKVLRHSDLGITTDKDLLRLIIKGLNFIILALNDIDKRLERLEQN